MFNFIKTLIKTLKLNIIAKYVIVPLLVLLGVFIGQGNSVEKISNKSISN